MYNGNTVFGNVLQLIPRIEFERLVVKHNTNYYTKKFDTWSHFVTLLFAQIRGIESLRDISISFSQHLNKLYHLGLIPEPIAKSTLSDANRRIKYQFYEDLFYI